MLLLKPQVLPSLQASFLRTQGTPERACLSPTSWQLTSPDLKSLLAGPKFAWISKSKSLCLQHYLMLTRGKLKSMTICQVCWINLLKINKVKNGKECYFQLGKRKFLIADCERELTRKVCKQEIQSYRTLNIIPLVTLSPRTCWVVFITLISPELGALGLLNLEDGFHFHSFFENLCISLICISLMINVLHCGVPWTAASQLCECEILKAPLILLPFIQRGGLGRANFPIQIYFLSWKSKKSCSFQLTLHFFSQ